MRRVLARGDIAVDVGAYKGGYLYWMRWEVGEEGAVLAVEPQPELAAYLRRCVGDLGWRNVRVAETALSSASGVRVLHTPGPGPSPGASLVGASLPADTRATEVPVSTLDTLLADTGLRSRVRLIKCDVEGHELDVFRGATETLERDRPHLLFECEARHLRDCSMQDVFGHLAALGYRGSFFWRGSRLAVGDFDAAEHQVEGRRPYANNFVFVAREEPDSA
jgi:FkbM family methyltransferase